MSDTKPTVDPNTYTCEACGGTFDKPWTDEEAWEEADREFPGLVPEDAAIVCDECYRKVMRAPFPPPADAPMEDFLRRMQEALPKVQFRSPLVKGGKGRPMAKLTPEFVSRWGNPELLGAIKWKGVSLSEYSLSELLAILGYVAVEERKRQARVLGTDSLAALPPAVRKAIDGH